MLHDLGWKNVKDRRRNLRQAGMFPLPWYYATKPNTVQVSGNDSEVHFFYAEYQVIYPKLKLCVQIKASINDM